jgi:GNAT superfamily N-acetyltransferase
VIIRPYRSSDRAAVRRICHATGYMGGSAEWFWRDERSFADVFCGWYTDHEPGSAYVAVAGRGEEAPAGTVVGYLLGALDAARVQDVASVVLAHGLGRLLVVRPGTAGVLWRGLWDVTREVAGGRGLPADRFVDARFPSHFHLDLLPAARGHGAGRRLLETWLDRLRTAGSSGCHLETLAENRPAIRFFEQAGFEAYGPTRPAPGFRTRAGKPMRILVMVRTLSREAPPAAADR